MDIDFIKLSKSARKEIIEKCKSVSKTEELFNISIKAVDLLEILTKEYSDKPIPLKNTRGSQG